MSKLLKKVLLDTNVWVDYYTGRTSGFASSSEAIRLCVSQGIALFVTSTATKDIYYLIKAFLKREMRKADNSNIAPDQAKAIDEVAWQSITHLMQNVSLIGIGSSECKRALQLRQVHDDYEDCIVLAVIESSDIDFFVTNDEALLKKSPIKAMTSQGLCEYLECTI